jgi:hypothetical protein
MNNKKKSFWLSYDFGLRGNYTGLFTFLDNHDAIDCGNGLAYFLYDNPSNLNSENLVDKIKLELSDLVAPSPSDRVYMIWRDEESTTSKVKGKFIFGNRKAAAWNGYSNLVKNNSNEEAV